MLTRGVHKALRSDAESLATEAQAQGGTVYFINGSGVVDRDSFFDAVRSTLPVDPPIKSNYSWDALSDSVWSGLDGLETSRILIVWLDSDRLEKSSEDFEMAINVLRDITETLASPKLTQGKPKEVTVLLS